MNRGTHGEKIVAAMESDKLPTVDKDRLKEAIAVYDKWVEELKTADAEDLNALIDLMVSKLNEY